MYYEKKFIILNAIQVILTKYISHTTHAKYPHTKNLKRSKRKILKSSEEEQDKWEKNTCERYHKVTEEEKET